MLETVDLSLALDKKEYDEQIVMNQVALTALGFQVYKQHRPVIILFEGWDASGKGTSIHALTQPLDPRGYRIFPIRAPRTYENNHPWLWRFWSKLPARGEWAIFDRSWYGRVMVERVEKLIPEDDWRRGFLDITDFERTIADDGTLIIKFFMHISKDEQKRRFKKLSKDPLNAWRITPEDWEHHKNYKQWMLAYEEAFENTNTEWGPWTIVEATDRRYTRLKIAETIVRAMEERLKTPIQATGAETEQPAAAV